MADERVTYDLDSYDVVTTALMDLLNRYPELDGDEVGFSVLSSESGVAMFPTSGAVVNSEVEDVTNHVEQVCSYPFIVIYRAGGLSETRKARVKEFLDDLGKWLERQEITYHGANYRLTEYPQLSGNRSFRKIERTSPAYLMQTTTDAVDDWAISLQATYRNEFDRD